MKKNLKLLFALFIKGKRSINQKAALLIKLVFPTLKSQYSFRKALPGLLSLAIIFFTASRQANAQWSDNPAVNNAICLATADQYDPKIIADGAGGAVIIWQETRNGNNDVYAQRVNASGTLQWTANGIAICTDAEEQFRPTLASDGAGGAIITWDDQRSGNFDIYAQRINASGTVQWTPNGIAVCTSPDGQFEPGIISDNAGGAIITWSDNRNGNNFDVYAQRINASGTVQWTPNGIAVCTEVGDQLYARITSDDAGGAIIIWDDRRSGSNNDVYAQRVNASGIVQWIAEGIAVCTAAESQYYPTIVSDGAGGAIVTWMDNRSGNYDIYAQQVDASGVVDWTADGVAVCTTADDQYNPTLVSDGAGGAIITWDDYRNINASIYAQRVNASGVVQWVPGGVAVCTVGGVGPTIIGDGAGGAIITWEDYRNAASYADNYAQRVNASGAVQWLADGIAVSTAAGYQSNPRLSSDGTGGAIITWDDTRSENFQSDIYAQKVNADGTLACGSPAVSGEPQVQQTVCKNSATMQLTVTATGSANTYQWYADNNNTGYNGTEISGQTGRSFTPPSTTTGTFYYYAVVSNTCGTATSVYSKVTVEPLLVWYQDYDNDGYGTAAVTQMKCTRPAGYESKAGDCNDKDKTIYPGAHELCDNKDNDCDGKTDEYLTKKTYYKDQDKDGYGDYREWKTACTLPDGYAAKGGDCNDRNNKVYPYAKELCDGLDNDCDGKIDEYLTKKNFYRDYDCDGYGNSNKCIVACAAPAGYVSDKRDCDDYNKKVHPYAKEICDGLDNDCDGKTDEGFTTKSYYKDYDRDGYGDPKERKASCSAPSGYVANNDDCNDRNKNVRPGCREIAGNKIDDNCNGKVDESSSYASRGTNDKEIYQQTSKGLILKVLPNPSPDHFTLNVTGGNNMPVQLRVVDISGRMVEVKSNIRANSTVTIGDRYRPGIYLVEVMQGSERVVIRCIKQ